MQQVNKTISLRSTFEESGLLPSDICNTPSVESFTKGILRLNGTKVYSLLFDDDENVIYKSGNIVLDGKSLGASNQVIFNTFDILSESGAVILKANCTMEDF